MRIESRLEKIFSMGINCMSLAEWLGEDRKCSATAQAAQTRDERKQLSVNETYANVTLPSSSVVLQRCHLQGFVLELYGFALNT